MAVNNHQYGNYIRALKSHVVPYLDREFSCVGQEEHYKDIISSKDQEIVKLKAELEANRNTPNETYHAGQTRWSFK